MYQHAVPLQGCTDKVEKAMAAIGSFKGVETSVADVDTWAVTAAGTVNPTELCQWLKSRTRKDVQIFYPDPPAQNIRKKMVLVLGSSSKTGYTTPSAPVLLDQMSGALAPTGVQSDHDDIQSIEEMIRNLEKVRDMMKIQNLQNELTAVKCKLKQSREVISNSKKAVLDSALHQLKAYKELEELS